MNDTRAAIIHAGLELWRKGSESDVSARRIAGMIGITHPGVLNHWGKAGAAARMRDEIARTAVALGDAAIIPKLIVSGHSAVSAMDATTRQAWLAGC